LGKRAKVEDAYPEEKEYDRLVKEIFVLFPCLMKYPDMGLDLSVSVCSFGPKNKLKAFVQKYIYIFLYAKKNVFMKTKL
jgi:hypothetical protein